MYYFIHTIEYEKNHKNKTFKSKFFPENNLNLHILYINIFVTFYYKYFFKKYLKV